jgi:hypothetical protein
MQVPIGRADVQIGAGNRGSAFPSQDFDGKHPLALSGINVERQEFPFKGDGKGPPTRTGNSRRDASTGRVRPPRSALRSVNGMYSGAMGSVSTNHHNIGSD